MARKPNKTIELRRQRVETILKATYPEAKCSLSFRNPLQLIVATILSAQCTDERVNIVTRDLFRKYRSAADYADAPEGELEADIQSTGFYRNKARSLRAMGRALVERHGGEVPRTMEELTQLGGVGRKTANVVLGNAFGINVGVTVDTHVTRLANRLKLTKHASDAVKIEKDLMQIVPQAEWTLFSHLLIHHGRAICVARSPRCERCPIFEQCPTGPKVIAEREKAGLQKPRAKARPAQPRPR